MVWFDLNPNADGPHEVAALVSARGVNALTGQRLTPPPRLEQYAHQCPVHAVPFTRVGTETKFCPTCNFGWAPQNYFSTTSVGRGLFWRDGFRGPDGNTREFVFTAERNRGVARAVIGDDAVDAFGVALFRSAKSKAPPVAYRTPYAFKGSPFSFGGEFGGVRLESSASHRRHLGIAERNEALEVAAGAVVDQGVRPDEHRLDFWREAPDACLILYYVGPHAFRDIAGFDGTENPADEGWLGKAGVPVGNDA